MSTPKQDYTYHGKILNVVDGDTIDVEIDLGFYVYSKQRMRLSGIDTAELNSPDEGLRKLAKQAKSWVQAALLKYSDLPVIIKSHKKDKYGRFLAEIYLPGQKESLNQKLIDIGLAKVYNGGKR